MRSTAAVSRGMLLIGVVGAAALAASPSTARAQKTETLYAVGAHPDDEIGGWGIVDQRPKTYTIFVTMTQGENTRSCLTPEESGSPPAEPPDPGPHPEDLGYKGPYRYQGPGSPVGQPDKGEVHPLGNPWQGLGTEACRAARLSSWHGFLDEMGTLDPTLPVAPPYQGEFCKGRIGCARVWADDLGARVAFDLTDGKLTPAQVVKGIELLRVRRRHWGIHVLPESQIASVAFHNTEHVCSESYVHTDHKAVQDGIYGHSFSVPQRLGVTCEGDPRLAGGSQVESNARPTFFYDAFAIDPVTGRRLGAYVRHYGWLFDTYAWFGGGPTYLFWARAAAT